LILRPVCLADAETTYAYAADREMIRYMVYLPKASMEEVREFLNKRNQS